MDNSDVFKSVRQRRVAFQWYLEYEKIDFDKLSIDDKLDYAYRWLNWKVDDDILRFYAKKEGMDFEEYKKTISLDN